MSLRHLALLPVLLLATDVAAATRTSLTFVEPPTQARYSQAINLELALTIEGGAALIGSTDCDPNPDDDTDLLCRVVVELHKADTPETVIAITEPDVVVDDSGRARVRVTFVDGRYGGATFSASADGTDYVVTARFTDASGTRPSDCVDVDGENDGRRCPAEATATVALIPEVPALTFNRDVVLALGESVTLAASLQDDTGDAEVAGSDVDGTAPRVLAGLPIRFFYDAADNGRPSVSELIGEGTTNAAGVATVVFNAFAPDVTAGVFSAGLHAEFPGDGRYALARTSVSLTVSSSGVPDPARTVFIVSPSVIGLDVPAEAVVNARLVDADNNIIGADSPEQDVVFSTDLGRLIDSVQRDPLDGSYRQSLILPRTRGTATLTVTVNGVAAGTATVDIDGPEGCSCAGLGTVAPALFVVALLARGRRRRA